MANKPLPLTISSDRQPGAWLDKVNENWSDSCGMWVQQSDNRYQKVRSLIKLMLSGCGIEYLSI